MKKIIVCCLSLLLSPMFLRSQVANNTSLVGNVIDPAGSAISSGHVIAVEENTKVKSEAQTNSSGYYAITYILPGTYDITAYTYGPGPGVVDTSVPLATVVPWATCGTSPTRSSCSRATTRPCARCRRSSRPSARKIRCSTTRGASAQR